MALVVIPAKAGISFFLFHNSRHSRESGNLFLFTSQQPSFPRKRESLSFYFTTVVIPAKAGICRHL
jgi:hypothetical protein